MVDIKSNEREFMSQVASWLNEFLKSGTYPFEVVSSEASVKYEGKTKIPDVQVWLNRRSNQGFCEIALKTPETSADDQELLDDAAKNARAMYADYFVTWNMTDAVIWRTPLRAEAVSRIHRLKTYSPVHQVSRPDDLWVGFKQDLLKAKAKEILNDLSNLYRDGHLHLVDVDSVFFVHVLSEAAKTLCPLMRESLVSEIGKKPKFKEGLFDWAAKQCIPRYDEGETFFEAVSRQIVYRLLGKILFYLTLRRFRSDIPKLDLHGEASEKISEKLKEHFEIARQIDYQAVFDEDFPDRVPFPVNAVKPLLNLLDDLQRFNFSNMPQDVVGNVFETLIPTEERHGLGQYFTNENLVDLITAFCVRSKTDRVLDPTCGTGSFLIRAYDRLKYSGEKDHKKLLSQIWGVDIASFPAELATINLYRQNIEDYANFPRIISKDFFEVKPGDTFKFPPPKPICDPDFMIDEEMPEFDAVVGNFPYIRQELVEKRIRGYKNTLTRVLSQDWRADYPDLFNDGGIRLSGQADIYAYLFFHAARHLKDGGRMGIVTSNAWLDVAFGYELQRFFLKNLKVVAILESRCEPWFEDVAINTIITVLERCNNKEQRESNNIKFVKIKKRLKDLIPWDVKLPMQRWFGLDKLVHTIEKAGSEHLELKGTKFINTLKGHAKYEDDNFRIRVLRQSELLEKLEETGKTVKWGQYLRAPEIYFEILGRCKDKLVPLKNIADVRYGIKAGINEFFFLNDYKIKHWGIEKEFVAPIIKSMKELDTIKVDKKYLKIKVFKCDKSKKELLRDKNIGALEYIKWGEKQKTKERGRYKMGGIPFPKVPSVKGRKYWYDIDDRKAGDFLINQFVSERFFFPINDGYLADHTVFEGKFKKKGTSDIYTATLNSSLTSLFTELQGRFNLGDGLLTFYGPDIADLLVPNTNIILKTSRQKILKAFKKPLARQVKPIFEEIKMKDRQVLDSAVLEALGLDPKKYLNPLYEGLSEMVRERIDLAKSRRKIKNSKTRNDIEKLKEQVIEEVIPDGTKRFPEEFIDRKYLKDSREISVPRESLKLGYYFMGAQEVVSEGGFKYEAESADEAKFIIYSQKPDSYIIKIPNKNSVVINAVKDYERYLKKLKAKFFEVFFNRILDHKMADMLVQQIFDEMGLPEV